MINMKCEKFDNRVVFDTSWIKRPYPTLNPYSGKDFACGCTEITHTEASLSDGIVEKKSYDCSKCIYRKENNNG